MLHAIINNQAKYKMLLIISLTGGSVGGAVEV